MDPALYSNNIENALVSGGLGATLSTTFAGLTLSRYVSPMGFIGSSGILAGLAGFHIFRQERHMIGVGRNEQIAIGGMSGHNRLFFGWSAHTIPFFLLSLALFFFFSSFWAVLQYGAMAASIAGGLT